MSAVTAQDIHQQGACADGFAGGGGHDACFEHVGRRRGDRRYRAGQAADGNDLPVGQVSAAPSKRAPWGNIVCGGNLVASLCS